MERQENRLYQITVDSSGRIVIPAEARQRQHISEGDTLIVREDEKGLTISSLDQVLSESEAFFKALTPDGALLSDEINADRRAENERD